VRVGSGGDERRGLERWEGFQQENRKRRGLFAKSQLVGGVESKNARGGFGCFFEKKGRVRLGTRVWPGGRLLG
jgi:hypothetical protein